MQNLSTVSTYNFPEKVLQFGTGVLLRGLCDYQIDMANSQGVFEGNIIIVKSTGPDVSEFIDQNNLYTVCTRGIDGKNSIIENSIIRSISRVLSAETSWEEILITAESADMQIVISNTTEVGLRYAAENIIDTCPESYPGKLTAWLLRRYQSIKASVLIIPTELIVDNGILLKEMVLKHAENNNLGIDFVNWLNVSVKFCSSLVDRIIPGKPKGQDLEDLYADLGYRDNLVLIAEHYNLWAIEGEGIEDVLSFAKINPGVIIDKNIEKYRELKLRLLNATHTLMCGVGYLSGYTFVKEALANDHFEKYVTNLMLSEISEAFPLNIDNKIKHRYSNEVLDRFKNPYLNHQWLSITLQYTLKMRSRAIPLLNKYYETFGSTPHYFARCFAAYLLFMKANKIEGGKYYGEYNNSSYKIDCEYANYFHEIWQYPNVESMVSAICANKDLWGHDLSKLPDFVNQVSLHLNNMQMIGVKDAMSSLNVYA